MFRSEQMLHFEINIPRDSGWNVMNNLGTTPYIEFIDMNDDVPAFNRNFANYVRTCDESLARLLSVELLMDKFSVPKKVNTRILEKDYYHSFFPKYIVSVYFGKRRITLYNNTYK